MAHGVQETMKEQSVALKDCTRRFLARKQPIEHPSLLIKSPMSPRRMPICHDQADDFLIGGLNGHHRCYVTEVAGRRLTQLEGVDRAELRLSRTLASQLFQAIGHLYAHSVAYGNSSAPTSTQVVRSRKK